MNNKKKRKKRKDICRFCKRKMDVIYEECPRCGGEEYYECPKCGRLYETDTLEEL